MGEPSGFSIYIYHSKNGVKRKFTMKKGWFRNLFLKSARFLCKITRRKSN